MLESDSYNPSKWAVNRLNHNLVLGVILVPIIFEILRKYILYSNIWFVIMDFLFILIFVRTLFKFNPHFIFLCWSFVIIVFVLHGLIFSLIYEYSPLTLLFGLRTAFYPLVGFLVASSLDFDRRLIDKIILLLLILLLSVSFFGLLQILLVDNPWSLSTHWINYVPDEIEYGRSLGFGGYNEEINAMFPSVNLYRPHSIFLHTGKFGQVVWGFSAILIMLSGGLSSKKRGLIFITIILCNMITMQRAALYPILLFMSIYIFTFSSRKLILMCLFFFFAFFIILIGSENIYLVLERIFSALPEIPRRLPTVLYAASGVLDNGILGDGWSYYSTGAQMVGGGNYAQYYGGEGGWIIMAAEVGVPITLVLFLSNVVLGLLIFFKSIFINRDRYLSFWTGYVVLLLPVWAVTHNIYGSYLMMLYATIAIGLYYNASLNLKIRDKLF